MIQPGEVIGGRFRVYRVLGAGGMGLVVAATHTELGHQVALKVLHDELATNPTIVARFLREAKAVATLRTEHVCRVFDVGRLDSGAPFIVMELLDGTDLTGAALKGVPMTVAVEYVIQACVALAEAHAVGLVHRDIKPPNLFVVRRPDGGPLVKVLDFGIAKAATAAEAKLTHTTSTMGSPGYMSPEQIRSTRDVDLRTDIWALGVTLYQLLSARMPFGGTQLAEIAVAVMTASPAPLSVDPTLEAIVLRCLEKEPERRFASVAELAVALMPFGGPSAPRFVREITRGAVGGEAPPPAPFVPVTAPTAASMMTGATGPTGPQHAPPMTGMPGVVPQTPAPTVASAGKGKWIAIGAALLVVLVGGGALAGYLARGGGGGAGSGSGSSVAVVVDAGASADASAVVIDAAAAPVAVDASGDPWNGGGPNGGGLAGVEQDSADSGDSDASEEEVMAEARAQIAMARSMMTDAQRKQLVTQVAQMEKALGTMQKSNPAMFHQQVLSLVSVACYLGDDAMARRNVVKIADANDRLGAITACKQMGIDLAKPAQKM